MGDVVSIGERLKSHREELGMSQAQAARELDVARTAYRLWEMEAAKPAPDRWRLIARWLGVSVATMLLAEELIDEAEASAADQVAKRLARDGVAWDAESDGEGGNFFNQERSKIQDEEASGRISRGRIHPARRCPRSARGSLERAPELGLEARVPAQGTPSRTRQLPHSLEQRLQSPPPACPRCSSKMPCFSRANSSPTAFSTRPTGNDFLTA